MAYTKQTWQNGDVITDNKLNHMEDGIANAGGGESLTVIFTTTDNGSTYTADKTFQEVYDANVNHIPVFGYYGAEGDDAFSPIPFMGADYLEEPVEIGRAHFARNDVYTDDMYMECREFIINLDGTVTNNLTQFTLTPQV